MPQPIKPLKQRRARNKALATVAYTKHTQARQHSTKAEKRARKALRNRQRWFRQFRVQQAAALSKTMVDSMFGDTEPVDDGAHSVAHGSKE